jgi:threonine/homoserine/homoserine lactone efflux protein
MPDAGTFGLLPMAALVLAITLGPGIFYVWTRSLKGGRAEGVASSMGNALGGLLHVLAAALGLSAILMASATAFTVVKLAGAGYLVYLGMRTSLSRSHEHHAPATSHRPTRSWDAFYQGIMAEILNPKTALSLLAFLPQFVNPQGSVVLQSQYRNAAEALLRRLAKHGDIPTINTLVDIGNLVSIRYAMPVAVFDQANIAGGSITVRFATGAELFTDLGSTDVVPLILAKSSSSTATMS